MLGIRCGHGDNICSIHTGHHILGQILSSTARAADICFWYVAYNTDSQGGTQHQQDLEIQNHYTEQTQRS
jgi:hypothetical protein